jgi:hypothetical protein
MDCGVGREECHKGEQDVAREGWAGDARLRSAISFFARFPLRVI